MIKLNIQLFGGRGASSSSQTKKMSDGIRTSKKTTIKKPTVEKTTIGGEISFSNRKNLVASINEQLSINLDESATSRQFAPRSGLNIDSRKLSKNDLATVRSYAAKKGIRMESNGVYDYFIYFKK